MRWYVVQTHAHAEARAAAHLARQGFVTYLPCYLKRRRHARKVDNVSAALFPRYLFVAVDTGTQRWRAIQSTVGVTRLVCRGNDPAVVPDAVIDALRQREDSAGHVKLVRPPRFQAGAAVRVVEGAFASCLGLFESMSDSDRVSILLDLLGRKVRVILNEEDLAAA